MQVLVVSARCPICMISGSVHDAREVVFGAIFGSLEASREALVLH